jgi:hypothetical protein
MRRYVLFGGVHFSLTVASWYFIGAMAQGVADGTGVAPTWLVIVGQLSRVLTFPLVELIVAQHWPPWHWFTLGGFLTLVFIAVANSALITTGFWLVNRWVRRQRPKDSARP